MSYSNVKTYMLKYSDFDFKDELKLSALLELAQESAGGSADELGFGYGALKPLGYGFIVVSTHCKFLRPIRLGDVLTVETWPLPPRHVIFERDYRVTDGEGEAVALLASRWCLVDLKSFSLLTPDRLGETHTKCPYRDEKALEVPLWKIPRIRNGRLVRSMSVGNSNCDHYLHANNAKYADFFLDCFTMEELNELQITCFHISYSKQAKEGETLSFYREDTQDGTTLEAFDESNALCTQLRLWYERR